MSVKFTFDKNKVMARLINASEKGIFATSTQALKDSNYYVKKDVGDLEGSAIIASNLEKGLLIWDEPYAKMQYYLDSASKDPNPNARKMWAHYAYSVHKDTWLAVMQAEFKRQAKE